MTVQQNIARKETALENLKAHCLCLRVDGNIVYLPYGYGVDALRINETANGYERAAEYLEKVWQGSCFWK
jgi:hypothetical protein